MSLFSDKHKFMCYVFSNALQTYRGKKFIREHEDDCNAQMVYKKFHGFYATSVGARVSASDMLSYITSAKFDSWKGTTESFILNRKDQVRLYVSLVDADRNVYENYKKIILEYAVASVKPLSYVKD